MAPAPTACVTGATGYVASELIRQLLSRGYAVKATVRCAPNSDRLQYLRDLANKSEGTLELVQVPDIEHASDALESAVQGVSYVFHVASPFRFDGEQQQKQLQDSNQTMFWQQSDHVLAAGQSQTRCHAPVRCTKRHKGPGITHLPVVASG